MDVAQAGMTIDDGESGGLVGSERQQGKMAGEGDSGRFGGACCFLGPELRGGSQADVAQADEDWKRMGRLGSASEEQKKTMDSNASVLAQLLAMQKAQARHMGVPMPDGVGQGGMGSKGVGGSADGFATAADGESGVGSERRQGKVVSKGDDGRPGVACCFQGPELRAGSQAGMAQGSVAADNGVIGGSLGGE